MMADRAREHSRNEEDYPHGKTMPQPSKAPAGSELVEFAMRAMKERSTMASEADGSPESMPELARELTMLRGAIVGLNRRAAELVAKVQPVSCRSMEEITEAPKPVGMDDEPSTDVAKLIREAIKEIAALEYFLAEATGALRL